jgi:hypothetical protein
MKYLFYYSLFLSSKEICFVTTFDIIISVAYFRSRQRSISVNRYFLTDNAVGEVCFMSRFQTVIFDAVWLGSWNPFDIAIAALGYQFRTKFMMPLMMLILEFD